MSFFMTFIEDTNLDMLPIFLYIWGMKTPVALLQEEIARRLKTLREGAGKSQVELAARMKVPRTTISNIEGGRQGMPLILIYQFCKDLGISIQDLLPSVQEFEQLCQQTVELGGVTKTVPPLLAAQLRSLATNCPSLTEEDTP